MTFSASAGFAARLAAANASLLFTSYHSNMLYLLGRNTSGGLNVHHTALDKPMGIATTSTGGFFVGTRNGLSRFESPLAAHERANEEFDACFVPRQEHFTGSLDVHDIGTGPEDGPVFVNTAFNCLAQPDVRHSFCEVWRPPFISATVREDRCHLNGLAMENNAPAFVTAASRSDTIDGWRDRRADGGIVMDVRSGDVVADGLSMPHSPRLHDGQLWVLNSGAGEVGRVDPAGGGFEPLAFCPGFVRGLAFDGQSCFVGLSKPRYARFEGLALDARLTEKDSAPWCGIQVIDLQTGHCTEWFRLDGAVAEIYDVALIRGCSMPMALSAGSAEAATFTTHRPIGAVR